MTLIVALYHDTNFEVRPLKSDIDLFESNQVIVYHTRHVTLILLAITIKY